MGAIRRATGQHINPFEKMTKSLLTYLMGQAGYDLDVVKQDVPDSHYKHVRYFRAVAREGEHWFNLDVVYAGETPDWQYMHDMFTTRVGESDGSN